MAKWQDLPPELVLHILQKLNNTRDHNNASFVSRQFHALVEPQLYSDISILPNLRDDDEDDDDGGEARTRGFRHFVRTIVRRPSLGSHVKRLKLASWEHNYYEFPDDLHRCHLKFPDEDRDEALAYAKYDGTREDLTIIAAAAVARGLPNGMILAAGSRGLAIVLLHYLPNLKHLSVVSRNEIETVGLSCLGSFEGGVPAGLLSISTLNMVYDNSVYDEIEVCPRIPEWDGLLWDCL